MNIVMGRIYIPAYRPKPQAARMGLLLFLVSLLLMSWMFSATCALAEPTDPDSATAHIAQEAANEADKNENAPTKETSARTSVPSAVPAPDDKLELEDYQDPGQEQKKTSWFMGIVDSILNFIKYIFYLAVVLAVGLLAIYGVKIFTTKYNALTGGGHEILNVLEVRYMAPGKALCLVEVAGKVLVLGLAGNNINHLSDISEPEQVERIKTAVAAKPEPLQPFQGYFEKVIDRFMYAPGKSAKTSKAVKVKDLDAPSKSTGASRPKRTPETTNGSWREDLNSTGDNLRKLLEDIKEQDKKGKDRRPGPSSRRGDDDR